MSLSFSGIYRIYNSATNKSYIGSSVNLRDRRRQHFRLLEKNSHQNIKLQNSFNKYGAENFIFEPLGQVPREFLVEVEQLAIDICKPEYNITLQAGGGCFGLPAWNKGIPLSIERKKKMLDGLKGKPAWNRGGYSRELREEKSKRFSKAILAYSLEGNFVKEFTSITEARISLNLKSGSGIIAALKGRAKSCSGFQFRYKIENQFLFSIEPYSGKAESTTIRKVNNKYIYIGLKN